MQVSVISSKSKVFTALSDLLSQQKIPLEGDLIKEDCQA